MPEYARYLLIAVGISLLLLNLWYLKRGMRLRRLEESLGLEGNDAAFVKPGQREESRLQFWVLTMGNAIGLFLACIIILGFVANDIRIMIHYVSAHQGNTLSP